MINQNIWQQLAALTPIEKKQIAKHQFVNDLSPYVLITNGKKRVVNQKLLSHHSIYLSKHNRFAPYPLHSHEFVEINYMLKGNCDELVEGEHIHLTQGDVLMMDIGCHHCIDQLDKNDLMINLIFNNKNISLQNENKQKFIIFPKNEDITNTMDDIINEYYSGSIYRGLIIDNYFNILLAKIIRNYPMIEKKVYGNQSRLLVDLLTEISNDYQNVSLSKLADRYGYTKPYLSNLIKKLTGHTFIELRTKKRLEQAQYLLTSSNYSIAKICELVGIHNQNSFYTKFKQQYQMMPSDYRKKNYLTDHFI
ncbi:AraC family transcriptional regulator [Lactobacillus kefiranofaciens]|uniref:AraC family transcriptional regulator n=1 Tax=Lactobacillus kefiranofaciens TaxID=267818 RepID=A0AAX3UEV9_9LACO|nr:AraC family transcriptional regulator [Lactobacillus kefiranofaciens]AEG40477.1 AraC family transcriptional regulator [Lactobacillus kefiranofaciens subsp. kefiranofaciens]KRL24387.1 AraC family transcriptional regulator [Lactobacillus kefiranofaciens subsp. kefirgranum DSM 10550 = JCM 8572]KRM22499.1 AraC family transcriptional regulator [Lactobacillus kefiranofaciens subsp. kefiranofaciens DSM 5016 = JCM 6985]MDF4142188.1 AraC family transcriptional regulator [Lactobacillus kefiranofaciens